MFQISLRKIAVSLSKFSVILTAISFAEIFWHYAFENWNCFQISIKCFPSNFKTAYVLANVWTDFLVSEDGMALLLVCFQVPNPSRCDSQNPYLTLQM